MKFAPVSIAIGLVFAPLAAAAAFLITYAEYVHHYPDRRQPLKLATEAALVTLVFFLVLALVAGLILGAMADGQG
jgi:hypothetical protein